MAEIRSVVNTSSRWFHLLFYDTKCINIIPLCIFFKAVKRLVKRRLLTSDYRTKEAVEEIQTHHALLCL